MKLDSKCSTKDHQELLRRTFNEAWTMTHDLFMSGADYTRVITEIVDQNLTYPAEDMATLSRYGLAETKEFVSVRVWAAGRWERICILYLPQPILLPQNFGNLTTRARYPAHYIWGVIPEKWEIMTREARDSHIAWTIERAKSDVPETTERWFQEWHRLDAARGAERTLLSDFSRAKVKRTWRELMLELPIGGRYIPEAIGAVKTGPHRDSTHAAQREATCKHTTD